MASLGRTIRHGDQDTSQRGGALPLGNYLLEVESAEVTRTRSGSGKVAKLTIEVREPEQFKGRKIFLNINIENDNPEAERIGIEELSRLAKAVGIPEDQELEDTDDLLKIEFAARVGTEKDNPDRNRILRYEYPDDAEKLEIGVEKNQPTKSAGSRDRGSSRGSERGGREERGREDRGSRDRDSGRGSEDRGSRGRDDDRGSRDRGRGDDERGGRDEGRGRGSRDDDRGSRGRDDDRGSEDDNQGDNDGNSGSEGAGGRPWKGRGGSR